MSRGIRETSDAAYAWRGVAATLVFVLVGALIIAKGAGVLTTDVEVHTSVPAEAGRVAKNAQVTFQGLAVGQVSGTTGGPAVGDALPGTDVDLRIDKGSAGEIPPRSVVRVVPRTLFGDVDVEIVPPQYESARSADVTGISAGDELGFDTSAESVQLYDVYNRAVRLIDQLDPKKLQVTLTALAQALQGKGATLGEAIDHADSASRTLQPAVEDLLRASPDIASLAADMAKSTPAVLETLDNAIGLSQLVLDRPGSLERLLGAGLGAARSGQDVLARNGPGAIRLIGDADAITASFTATPNSLSTTTRALGTMADNGSVVFRTGRFDITAVPSFADPLPYTAADCESYENLVSSACTGAVQPDGERRQLGEMQAMAAGADPAAYTGGEPNPAMWAIAAPLVRGTEVSPR